MTDTDRLQHLRLLSAAKSRLGRLRIGDLKIARRGSQAPPPDRRMLGKQLFDELVRQLAPRSRPRNSDAQSAKAPGTLSDPPNKRTRAPQPNVGTLLYLVSLGVVATAIVVVFFGLGFFLLAHPNEELIAGPAAAELVSSPEKDAPTVTVQTELPHPATTSADPVTANATFDASSAQEPRVLRSNSDEATLATPAGVTQAKRTGIDRHRRAGARKHWAGVSRPGASAGAPPAVNGPERAWHWIVQSATGILAALSPPPPRQVPGLKTR